jgi:hypothetical protein
MNSADSFANMLHLCVDCCGHEDVRGRMLIRTLAASYT